jgi:hypothetical protein
VSPASTQLYSLDVCFIARSSRHRWGRGNSSSSLRAAWALFTPCAAALVQQLK